MKMHESPVSGRESRNNSPVSGGSSNGFMKGAAKGAGNKSQCDKKEVNWLTKSNTTQKGSSSGHSPGHGGFVPGKGQTV